jgi:hypothetical protein
LLDCTLIIYYCFYKVFINGEIMRRYAAISTIFLALILLSAPVSSQTVMIEAESYISSHDIDYGIIDGVPGPGCSGGDMLVGLDYPDEWVKYNVSISPYGEYAVSMKCRGDLGVQYRLQLAFLPEQVGIGQTVSFQFTGAGYG